MATTTNFGWETPDDTDLVKDGALAIRTLGSAIDTSLVDLKGGTTGQVLSKASNTDMDFTWVTSDDANAIQNTIVDAKGDLITATAADTPARLAVGSNNQVLTVDSSTATGLKWATPSSGTTLVGCTAFNSADVGIANAAMVALGFNSELYDTDGFHSTTTNTSRFTVPTGKAGKYLFTVHLSWQTSTCTNKLMTLYKNTTAMAEMNLLPAQNLARQASTMNQVFDLAVGDYVEVQIYQDSGGTLNIKGATTGTERSIASLIYLGA